MSRNRLPSFLLLERRLPHCHPRRKFEKIFRICFRCLPVMEFNIFPPLALPYFISLTLISFYRPFSSTQRGDSENSSNEQHLASEKSAAEKAAKTLALSRPSKVVIRYSKPELTALASTPSSLIRPAALNAQLVR